jgi:hypothetical protein
LREGAVTVTSLITQIWWRKIEVTLIIKGNVQHLLNKEFKKGRGGGGGGDGTEGDGGDGMEGRGRSSSIRVNSLN